MDKPAVLLHLVTSTGDVEYLLSDDAQRALVKADVMGSSFKTDLEDALSRFVEFSMDTGTATGGSNTTCVDTGKSWATNIWQGAVIEVHTAADGLAHYSTITSNTANTLTFGALAGAVSVAAGDDYAIRLQVGIADIYKWGGTAQTGRDMGAYGMPFLGSVYVNQDTAAADAARRFEATTKKLRDVLIKVTTNAQLFGDSSNQYLEITAGGSFAISQIDISTLYFKNATAGQNGIVTILGVNDT